MTVAGARSAILKILPYSLLVLLSAAGATAASARDQEPLAGFGEIEEARAGGLAVNHRAHWHQHVDRCAVASCAVAAFPVAAALGAVLGVEAELQ